MTTDTHTTRDPQPAERRTSDRLHPIDAYNWITTEALRNQRDLLEAMFESAEIDSADYKLRRNLIALHLEIRGHQEAIEREQRKIAELEASAATLSPSAAQPVAETPFAVGDRVMQRYGPYTGVIAKLHAPGSNCDMKIDVTGETHFVTLSDLIHLPATEAELATLPQVKPAPLGTPKDAGIEQELAEQGLRRAASHESGWYTYTSYGKVWATDLPAPETITAAPVAPPVSYDVAPSEPLQFHETTSTVDVPPIHADPLEGLRKAIEGHAALSRLEAMTKLYEMQRMAKNMTPTGVNPSTPEIVVRLRGLRIEEMGPNDCVIELIKLAELLTPATTSTAPARTGAKLERSQRTLLASVKQGNVATHRGSAREFALKELESMGLVYQGHRSSWYLTERGIAEYEAYAKSHR